MLQHNQLTKPKKKIFLATMDWRYSNTITLSSFNHTVTPLFHFSSSFLSPLSLIWCLSLIVVDWRSTLAVWTEAQRWQHGGLEINGDGMVVWSGGDGGFSFLSFRFSLSLTPILSLNLDVGFSFALNSCCQYWCWIYGGSGGGLLVVGGDGFTVGLRWLL